MPTSPPAAMTSGMANHGTHHGWIRRNRVGRRVEPLGYITAYPFRRETSSSGHLHVWATPGDANLRAPLVKRFDGRCRIRPLVRARAWRSHAENLELTFGPRVACPSTLGATAEGVGTDE